MNNTNGKNPGKRGEGSPPAHIDPAMQNSEPERMLEQIQDPALASVLRDFRASVHAWSDAAYRSRPLVLSPASRRTFWRRSLVWAFSTVLAAGVATGGVHEFHQRALSRQAAERQAEHQRQLALQEHAREADELLAKVDSDVSREVPSAMEPLASLIAEDDTQ
jgi:hypothetical protein